MHDTLLLTHPGCLLSHAKPLDTMFDRVRAEIASRPLTVLVTHWWEYYREMKPDLEFIAVLHRVADYLANEPGVHVISFADLATGRVTLPGMAAGTPPRPRVPGFGTAPLPGGPRAC